MAIDLAPVQESTVGKVGHDVLVGLFDKLAGKGVGPDYVAQQVHVLHEIQLLLTPNTQVLVAKGRGDVYDARPILHGDEIGSDDSWLEVRGPLQQTSLRETANVHAVHMGVIQRLVGKGDQLSASKGIK